MSKSAWFLIAAGLCVGTEPSAATSIPALSPAARLAQLEATVLQAAHVIVATVRSTEVDHLLDSTHAPVPVAVCTVDEVLAGPLAAGDTVRVIEHLPMGMGLGDSEVGRSFLLFLAQCPGNSLYGDRVREVAPRFRGELIDPDSLLIYEPRPSVVPWHSLRDSILTMARPTRTREFLRSAALVLQVEVQMTGIEAPTASGASGSSVRFATERSLVNPASGQPATFIDVALPSGGAGEPGQGALPVTREGERGYLVLTTAPAGDLVFQDGPYCFWHERGDSVFVRSVGWPCYSDTMTRAGLDTATFIRYVTSR